MPKAMQLMTFNSLLMFDIVFIFFLFLVGVTCLVYYLPPRELSPVSASDHEQFITTTTPAITGTACDHHHHHRQQHHQPHHRLDHGCIERCGPCHAGQQRAGRVVQSCAAAARRMSGEGGTPILQTERSLSGDSKQQTALQTCNQYRGRPLPPDCHQYQHQQQQHQQQQHQQQLASLHIAEATEEEETVEEVLLLDYSSGSLNQVLVMRHDSISSSTSSNRIVLHESAVVAPSYHEMERFVQIEVDNSSIGDGGGGGGGNSSSAATVCTVAHAPTPCCYVRAKVSDIKECHGPICDV